MEDCYCRRPESKPHYSARFIGGPLGGETLAVQEAFPIYQVPVYTRPSSRSYGELPPMPWNTLYAVQEYELDHVESRRKYYDLVYRWRDPSEQVRKDNAKLDAELRAAKSELAVLRIDLRKATTMADDLGDIRRILAKDYA